MRKMRCSYKDNYYSIERGIKMKKIEKLEKRIKELEKKLVEKELEATWREEEDNEKREQEWRDRGEQGIYG